MEKQASMVCTINPAQEKSDDSIKKMLVAQYGHASDEEIFDGSDDEQVSSSNKDSGKYQWIFHIVINKNYNQLITFQSNFIC